MLIRGLSLTQTLGKPRRHRREAMGDAALGTQPSAAEWQSTPRRYAFKLDNILQLPKPIECKGALGLWTVPDNILALLANQLSLRAGA